MGLGRRERIKTKVRNLGIAALSHVEILEYILYAFIPRKDTHSLAESLLNEFGQVENVLTAPPVLLEKIPGITPTIATFLSALKSIVTRAEVESLEGKARILTYEDATKYISAYIGYERVENLIALCFGPSGKLLHTKTISTCNTGGAPVNLPLIVQTALNFGATSVLLGHNHPSGDPTPSPADIDSTILVADTLNTLGIRLLDHIIVSGRDADCVRFYLEEEDGESILSTIFAENRFDFKPLKKPKK